MTKWLILGASTLLIAVLTGCSAPASSFEEEYEALDQSVLADNAVKVAECVEDETGFEVTAGSDGSVSYSGRQVPDSQSELVDAAIPACFEKLGFMSDGRLSASQLERLYNLQLQAQDCLANEGYESRDAPSEQVFADTWGTPDLWAPWAEMGKYQLSQEELLSLIERCPDPASFGSK